MQNMCLWDSVSQWSEYKNNSLAFTELDANGNATRGITYGALEKEAGAIGQWLISNGQSGANALLIYSKGYDFIIAFLACQDSGVIPIPLNRPSRKGGKEKIQKIVSAADASLVLTDSATKQKIGDFFESSSVTVAATDTLELHYEKRISAVERAESDVAFIQYTSGSTSFPKGVVISNKNCLYNLRMIKEASITS